MRLNTKLLLLFLGIALIPFIIIGTIAYNNMYRAIEKEVFVKLESVSTLKAERINLLFSQMEDDIFTLSTSPLTKQTLEAGTFDFTTNLEAQIEVRKNFEMAYGYNDLFLIDQAGSILFSAKKLDDFNTNLETGAYKDTNLAHVFKMAKERKEITISDFAYYQPVGKVVTFLGAPVFKGGRFVGVVALEANCDGINSIMQERTGLGKTGETYLIGADMLMRSDSTFESSPTFLKRKVVTECTRKWYREHILVDSTTGREAKPMVCLGCKGVEVFTMYRHIPQRGWALITEIDKEEALIPLYSLRQRVLMINAVFVAIIILAAFYFARLISGPIKKLTAGARIVGRGNLEHRIFVKSNDEIGELASAFNEMIAKRRQAEKERGQLIKNLESLTRVLETQKKDLEKVNLELDAFVYTASHDLRAPLRGIESFANFLEQDYADKVDAEGKDYLRRICLGVTRMEQLISDLLTLSRISRIKNPYEDVNIGELIKSVTDSIEFDLQAHHVELKIAKDMPVVYCDQIKIRQVFLNLINNAVKFSSKNNKENPRVEIGHNDREQEHEFYVRDNGIGIDQQNHQQVFGIFKRLHKSEEYEGTGAGLTIVKRVIVDHDGRIWIDSELGEGATFYFTIPKKLKKEKKLGEILVEQGIVSQKDIKGALKKQAGGDIRVPPYTGEIEEKL